MELSQQDRDRIFAEEKARHDAQTSLKKSEDQKKGKLSLIFFLLIFGFIGFIAIVQTPRTSSTTPALPSNIGTDEQIEFLLNNKAIRKLEITRHIAHIDPRIWTSINAEAKKNMALSIAVYCARKEKQTALWIKLYDNQSGKQLAEYDIFGFEVF